MKVSMIIPNLNHKTAFLQPWSYALNLAKELTFLGFKINLFTNRQSTKHLKFKTEVPFQVLPIYNLRSLNKNSSEIIKQTKPDVIYWFGNSLSGIYLRKLKGLHIPIILHISAMHYSFRELNALSWREKFSHWSHILFSLPPYNRSVRFLNNEVITSIIVTNRCTKERLIQLGVANEKISIAPLVFEPENFALKESESKTSARKELGLKKDSFIATYLGSPNTIRGTEVLVRSAAKLKSMLNNFTVLILSRRDYGESSKDEILLNRFVEKHKLDDVVKIIPGILSRKKVRQHILASNVIVLPFKIVQSEPNLAVLETMAVGTPLITTSTCGLPEIIGSDRGVLIRPDDSEELAQALCRLAYNSQEAHEISQKAKEYVKKLPNWSELAKWTATIVSSMIHNKLAMHNSGKP